MRGQIWIIFQYMFVLYFINVILLLRFNLVFRYEMRSNVWWPKFSGCLSLATKALFQLTRVIESCQIWVVIFTCKVHFCLCYRVQKRPNQFVSHVLAPRGVKVKTFIEYVHHITLAYGCKGKNLLSWYSPHTCKSHLSNCVPVVAMAWQEHNFLHITPHKDKTSLYSRSTYNLRVCGTNSYHFRKISYYCGSVMLVPSV